MLSEEKAYGGEKGVCERLGMGAVECGGKGVKGGALESISAGCCWCIFKFASDIPFGDIRVLLTLLRLPLVLGSGWLFRWDTLRSTCFLRLLDEALRFAGGEAGSAGMPLVVVTLVIGTLLGRGAYRSWPVYDPWVGSTKISANDMWAPSNE